MITFITGLPGNGKTLYALQYVVAWAKREKRQVYYHGIKGLSEALGWRKLDTQSELVNGKNEPPVDVPQWWTCPAGSIIVIDEAQNCGFGVRARGDAPVWSKGLETHRHLGLDLVFITQDPGLCDTHDTKLAERHFHVVRAFGLARGTVHEFSPVRRTVLTSRKGSIQHKWPFPKHVYKWYTSAELHTHRVRIPMRLVLLVLMPFVIAGLSWWAWARYLDPHRVKPLDAAKAVPLTSGAVVGGGGPSAKLNARQYVDQFRPRVASLDYTAAAYDDVTKPIVAPYPAACVSSESRGCKCYSQQGTALMVDKATCLGIVAGGFFVSWQQPLQPAFKLEPKPALPDVPVAAISLGGNPRGHILADGGGSGSVLPPSSESPAPSPAPKRPAVPR